MPFFLASGTLLGWYRNCMPIPWDNDVDVGVMISDWTPEIVRSMEGAGFTHFSTVGTRSAGLTEVFEKSGVRQDIHFYYPNSANKQVFTQLWEHDVSHRESWSPFVLEPALAFGLTVQVPADVELYLTEAYGNFMAKRTKSTLDGGWNSVTGPPNSGPGSLPMGVEGRKRREDAYSYTGSYTDYTGGSYSYSYSGSYSGSYSYSYSGSLQWILQWSKLHWARLFVRDRELHGRLGHRPRVQCSRRALHFPGRQPLPRRDRAGHVRSQGLLPVL